MYAIDVRGIVKKFGDFTAVKGISFTVPEGEIFGLLGPNGAGKSTLMRTVATLQEPTSGSIRFGDIDVLAEPDRLRRTLGSAATTAATATAAAATAAAATATAAAAAATASASAAAAAAATAAVATAAATAAASATTAAAASAAASASAAEAEAAASRHRQRARSRETERGPLRLLAAHRLGLGLRNRYRRHKRRRFVIVGGGQRRQ